MVAMNNRRDEEAAVVADIIANGDKAQAYAASVDDFEQNAEMVAAIAADHGIRVSIVAPRIVDTDMGLRLIHAVQGVEDIRT
jgi:hypothetical protein